MAPGKTWIPCGVMDVRGAPGVPQFSRSPCSARTFGEVLSRLATVVTRSFTRLNLGMPKTMPTPSKSACPSNTSSTMGRTHGLILLEMACDTMGSLAMDPAATPKTVATPVAKAPPTASAADRIKARAAPKPTANPAAVWVQNSVMSNSVSSVTQSVR